MAMDDEEHRPRSRQMFLLVYWLCCCLWYEDKSDKSSTRHLNRAELHEAGHRRRSTEVFSRRFGSSAVSLPGTSGHKKPLSAHRSHEEIGRRRSENKEDGRYHSAPSVIDEVIHRRDWERSTKELYIPLKPEPNSDESTPEPPHAEPESSSIECLKTEDQKPCKKHHKNIKSSRKHKESTSDDVKDSDATETDFYIGETKDDNVIKNDEENFDNEAKVKVCKAKEVKQSLNESIRSRDRPRSSLVPVDENHSGILGFDLGDVIDQLDALDRSGATHHMTESRISGARSVLPPPSVAAWVCSGHTWGAGRSRHASDGDILGATHRPQSGAFSESDLDLDLEAAEEIPPAYDELQQYVSPERKETAI